MEELTSLKNVFIANGYPEKLVRETFDRSWTTETLKAILKGVEQEVKPINQKDFFDVLHAL